MQKLEILIGISGSGKSTYSHEEWLKDPENTIVINRDKIRELLFGYTEESISTYYLRNDINKLEEIISHYEEIVIQKGLYHNKKVIIDATHLKIDYLRKYGQYNCELSFKFFDIDLNIAIDRDSKRNRKVGSEIIKKQKKQYDSLRKSALSEIESLVNIRYPRIS